MQGGGFNIFKNAMGLKLKRMIGLLLSIFLILLLSPIFLITTLMIAANTCAPIFYSQVRKGLNDTNFSANKFRSMGADAEKEGARWAEDDDTRVTCVGRLVRKTRNDELPQLWKVHKGEMSFIRPRPEQPDFIKQLEKEIPYYDLCHLVIPGITGSAQEIYPHGVSFEDAREKLLYDIFYIKNSCMLLDLVISGKILRIVLRQEGG